MKTITRYAVQRKSDNKFYKNPAAIYFEVDNYWDTRMGTARLWIYKPEIDEKLYKLITFTLKSNVKSKS